MLFKNLKNRLFSTAVILSLAVLSASCQVKDCSLETELIERLSCENEEVPAFSPAAEFSEPRFSDEYDLCPDNFVGFLFSSEQQRFNCSTEEFWYALSDARLETRQQAVDVLTLTTIMNGNSADKVALSHTYLLRGSLTMAMALENAQLFYMIAADFTINYDLRKSLELNPGSVTAEAFLDTMVMGTAIAFNDWETALPLGEASLQRVEAIGTSNPHELVGAAFSISGTMMGYPLITGYPQRAAELLALAGCPDSIDFCSQNTRNAPFALPGVKYHFAEIFARVGERSLAESYLQQAQDAERFDEWKYRSYVDDAVNDMDAYMKKWADFGDYKTSMFEGYATKSNGCSFCHSRQ